ncbi:Arc family DNA-binding protein [Bifidobacterium sp. ESL0728]|uniref:FitA-like ribbon-helix-helix domain-containing protein n=1 Tax=Bifidobacterium sp. ESL0728 TaxID=2983220 RepID=UPI0023F8D1A0|nr:Arc family DNA-binding protein [Bifidobacterium sp. ESL0728]WEV58760.1 Arc family DNA-binding protein [Bifidobacterium sp. ESL0728]
MKTLVIHDIPTDQLEKLKSVAQANHRSVETQVRLIIEDAVAKNDHSLTSAELFAKCHALLGDRGLEANEELVPPREKDNMRPVNFD